MSVAMRNSVLENMATLERNLHTMFSERSGVDIDIGSASKDIKIVFLGLILMGNMAILDQKSGSSDELEMDQDFQEWLEKHRFVTTYPPDRRIALMWTFRLSQIAFMKPGVAEEF